MTTPHSQVLIVGLGHIAQTHLKALEQIQGADVIAGVDTAPRPELAFRGHTVPAYQTIRDASDRHHPDVVVITTPTRTHAAVCADIAASFPAARILVEKPAADNLRDARQILEDIGSRQPVDVAYHMAFSPEVAWGQRVVKDNQQRFGPPAAIEASFTDPYQDEFESARQTLGNSWIDSGINALSVLSHFAAPVSRTSLRQIGEARRSVFEAHITCAAGRSELQALILTNWHVTDPAKTTRIRYSSGAELIMDHTAVAGYLVHEGQVAAVFGSDRSIPRRERHYLALYESWLTEGNRITPPQASMHLHELLLQPAGGM
jgi:predicted dehydrogenase